jgi:hypothetical protein
VDARGRLTKATTFMPCSFGPTPRSGAGDLFSDFLRVTVTVRWIPLVPAPYGTWVARPARTTTLAPGGDGSQLGRRVRPVLGELLLVGRSPEGSGVAVGGETRTLPRLRKGCLVAAALEV